MQIFPDCGCGCKGKEQEKKFMRALVLGVLFFIIANPETFTVMRKVFGYRISSATGYPTILGLALHAFIFLLVAWFLMNIKPSEKMTAPSWVTQTSNVSPDETAPTNWTPTDGTGGPPPASVPGSPAVPSTTLPEVGMPNTPPQPTSQSWDSMGKNLGGLDINEPTTAGSSWETCNFPSGKKVMVMN